MGFSAQTFALRRERALADLEGSVLVLSSAPPSFRSRDTETRYRADSELFYLTGVVDPGAVAVLRAGGDGGDFVLFVRPRDAAEERWSGERLGPEDAAQVFGADVAYSAETLPDRLPDLLAGGRRCLLPPWGRGGARASGRRRFADGPVKGNTKGCGPVRRRRSRAAARSDAFAQESAGVGDDAAGGRDHGRRILGDAGSRASRGGGVAARGRHRRGVPSQGGYGPGVSDNRRIWPQFVCSPLPRQRSRHL